MKYRRIAGEPADVHPSITPERIIDCRACRAERPAAGLHWDDLTEEKIGAIPLLSALRAARG